MTRRVSRTWIAAAAILALLLALLSQAGRYLAAPAAAAVPSDLIVTLGGDAGSRVRTSAALYGNRTAPRILLTGMDGGDPRARGSYLNWQALYLLEHGVPRDALLYDNRSANSWEEARNTLELMRAHNWKTVLVVSDPPHMRRLHWAWSRAFEGTGLQFRLVATDMPGWNAARWWTHERSAQFVITELVKLLYYQLQY